jgi:osmotically inducible protein OsmC
MATHRTAEVTWLGSLIEGSGTIASTTSGVLAPLPVTWTSRAEDPQGRTSPEDLLAAAQASCFAMALSGALADAGYPPDELRTSATVTFVPGTGITKSALTVHGRVPKIARAHSARLRRMRRPVAPSRRRSQACPRSRSTRSSKTKRPE